MGYNWRGKGVEKKKKKSNNCVTRATANLESYFRVTLLGQKKVKRFTSPVCISIYSIRKRLVDTDGISAKAVIDGIVKVGLLEDDSPKYVQEVRYSQEKGTEEKTVITIREV